MRRVRSNGQCGLYRQSDWAAAGQAQHRDMAEGNEFPWHPRPADKRPWLCTEAIEYVQCCDAEHLQERMKSAVLGHVKDTAGLASFPQRRAARRQH